MIFCWLLNYYWLLVYRWLCNSWLLTYCWLLIWLNFELWLTFELWWGTNKQTNKQTDKQTQEGKIGNNVTAIIDFKKTKITVFKYERDKYNIYYTLCSWGCSTNTFVINSARVLLPLEVQCHIKIFFYNVVPHCTAQTCT